MFPLACRVLLDDRRGAAVDQELSERLAVIGGVPQQRFRRRKWFDQVRRGLDVMTWRIPLMTSRLRRGFTPRRFFGIACSIASSSSSVSQNKLGIGALPSCGSFESEPTESRQMGIGFGA